MQNSINSGVVPAKTFIVGEYAALKQGPSLIVLTAPAFEFHYKFVGGTQLKGIPSGSPGDRLAQLSGFKGELLFSDSLKSGGFGASTAQFIAVASHVLNQASHKNWLEVYRECAWSGQGFRPSGADLMAQAFGEKLCCWEPETMSMTNLDWNFSELDFYIAKTPNKLATHKHLENLKDSDIEVSDLNPFIKDAKLSLENANESLFIEALVGFRKKLEEKHLVSEATRVLVSQLESNPVILFAKGCGALGADTVLVISKKNNSNQVLKLLKANNLVCYYSSQDLYLRPGGSNE